MRAVFFKLFLFIMFIIVNNTLAQNGCIKSLTYKYGLAGGDTPYDITVGDYNKDTHLDLAIVNRNSSNYTICLGLGNGNFNKGVLYGLPGYSYTDIEHADFNLDGNTDLVVGGNSGVDILIGNGDGTFKNAVSVNGYAAITGLEVKDVNYDGYADVQTLTMYSAGLVTQFNNGDATFSLPVLNTLGTYPMGFTMADVNSDNSLDVISANQGSDDMSILLGDSGVFNGLSSLGNVTNSDPYAVDASDINGDGFVDIAVVLSNINKVRIFFNDQQGSFTNPYYVSFPMPVYEVNLKDINGDTYKDLLVSGNSNIYISLNDGAGNFISFNTYNIGGLGYNLDYGDFNEDGYLDIAASPFDLNDYVILINDSNVGFNIHKKFQTGETPVDVLTLHSNADTLLDFITLNSGTHNIGVHTSIGNGFFNEPVFYNTEISGYSFVHEDFNLDGIKDIALSDISGHVAFLQGFNNGSFSLINIDTLAYSNSKGISAGDYNNDGFMDVAVCSDVYARILFLYGDGTFNFPGTHTHLMMSGNPDKIITRDLDFDGDSDLVVGFTSNSYFYTVKGNGDGTFENVQYYFTEQYPNEFILTNVNNDAYLDIVAVSSATSVDLSVFLGKDSVQFETAIKKDVPSYGGFNSIAAMDFDDNGITDLALSGNGFCIVFGDGNGDFDFPIYEEGSTNSTTSLIALDANSDHNLDFVSVNNFSSMYDVYLSNVALNIYVTATADTICKGDDVTLHGNGAVSYVWSDGVVDGFSFSPLTTNTYTVTGYDNSGCEGTATYTVGVEELILNIVASDTTVCLGDSIVLTATGGETYTWTNNIINGQYFAPQNSMYVSVYSGNHYGCFEYKGINIMVNTDKVFLNASADSVCNGGVVYFSQFGTEEDSIRWSYGSSNDTVLYLNQTTTFWVYSLDIYGCETYDTVQVFVRDIPNVNASAVDNEICEGETPLVQISGADTYSWSPYNPNSAALTQTAVFYLSGTDQYGCLGTDSIIINVNAKPIVSFQITDFNDTLCSTAGNVVLTGGSPEGGVYTGSGVTGNLFVPMALQPGQYILQYTFVDTNGCSASESQNVWIEICTGDVDYFSDRFNVYPNPFNNRIVIELDDLSTYNQFVIYDNVGRVIIQDDLTSIKTEVKIEGLSSGVYFLNIKGVNANKLLKLIK